MRLRHLPVFAHSPFVRLWETADAAREWSGNCTLATTDEFMTGPSNEHSICALLLGEFASERSLVNDIFQSCGWRLFEARDRLKALESVRRHGVRVVIADANLPGWSWQHIHRDLLRLPVPPELVVTSRMADEHLWAEVLNLGGYDVLARPFDREEVERVIAAASREFDRQLQSKPAARHAGSLSFF